MSSNDGFYLKHIFLMVLILFGVEYGLIDGWVESTNPCSTIGDYGGGGENIIVTNKRNNTKITYTW